MAPTKAEINRGITQRISSNRRPGTSVRAFIHARGTPMTAAPSVAPEANSNVVAISLPTEGCCIMREKPPRLKFPPSVNAA